MGLEHNSVYVQWESSRWSSVLPVEFTVGGTPLTQHTAPLVGKSNETQHIALSIDSHNTQLLLGKSNETQHIAVGFDLQLQ